MKKNTKTKSANKTVKNSLNITPLGDRVLIKPLSDGEGGAKSPSGIIIPDTVDSKQTDRGTVVAIGEGKREENGKITPIQVKVGQKVMFQWGEKIEIDGDEYYIVGEGNILALVN